LRPLQLLTPGCQYQHGDGLGAAIFGAGLVPADARFFGGIGDGARKLPVASKMAESCRFVPLGLATWLARHDVQLRAQAATVQCDDDITPELIAHLVWRCGGSYRMSDLERIVTERITPARLFDTESEQSPALLVAALPSLWKNVRTAIIRLLHMSATRTAPVLDDRLAQTVRVIRARRTQQACAAMIVLMDTCPPVACLKTPASAAAAEWVKNPHFLRDVPKPPLPQFPTVDIRKLCMKLPPLVRHNHPNQRILLSVRRNLGYHQHNGAGIVRCQYHGCPATFPEIKLPSSVSSELFRRYHWQAFFCRLHIKVVQLRMQIPDLFPCAVCATTSVDLEVISVKGGSPPGKTVWPRICATCKQHPAVQTQLFNYKRRIRSICSLTDRMEH